MVWAHKGYIGQCPARMLGIIGRDPIVSNIDQLLVDTFWFFLIKMHNTLQIPMNQSVIFLKS
jgi:hypothetical protein